MLKLITKTFPNESSRNSFKPALCCFFFAAFGICFFNIMRRKSNTPGRVRQGNEQPQAMPGSIYHTILHTGKAELTKAFANGDLVFLGLSTPAETHFELTDGLLKLLGSLNSNEMIIVDVSSTEFSNFLFSFNEQLKLMRWLHTQSHNIMRTPKKGK